MLNTNKNTYTIKFLEIKNPNNASGKVLIHMAKSKHKTVVEMLNQMMRQGIVKEWALDNYIF